MKVLGKIERVKFGFDRDCPRFGLFFTLSGKAWGVQDNIAALAVSVKHNARCQWTEASRDSAYAAMSHRIQKLLLDAKVNDVQDLVGKPIEATFEGNLLRDWRILEEVL